MRDGGFGGAQSALAPAGEQAARIEAHWWWLFAVATAVYVVVVAALLWAAARGRRRHREGAPVVERHRGMLLAVGASTGITVAILLVFLVYSFLTGRAMAAMPPENALTIDLVGHQWWWEVQYIDPDPSKRVRTANEIHIPVGRPVRFRLASRDVIHSFWVPNLSGKRDLTPGHDAETWFVADTPGVYRGQCAEFCGHQHAKMALLVIAVPPDEFNEWYARSLAPSATPTDSVALRGQEVFLGGSCIMCHTIAGTPAASNLGPDLTHLASRRTIAAGSLPNTRGHLAGWIVDPQGIKPGVRMPANQLDPEDLQALLVYLESLK
jgi:cytochrome c oxidase subunit II